MITVVDYQCTILFFFFSVLPLSRVLPFCADLREDRACPNSSTIPYAINHNGCSLRFLSVYSTSLKELFPQSASIRQTDTPCILLHWHKRKTTLMGRRVGKDDRWWRTRKASWNSNRKERGWKEKMTAITERRRAE